MKFTQWLVIIPARLKSERLPQKPLADLAGKPLIVRVYENLEPLRKLGAQVVVALDHSLTADVCKSHEIPFVMTAETLPSGTDRCHAAAQSFKNEAFVLNVQGDEPFIDTNDLIKLMSELEATSAPMATLGYKNTDWSHYNDPNVVKIVLNNRNEAIYFSRAPVPFDRDAQRSGSRNIVFWQHLGVYAYRREALASFCALPTSALEEKEKLEQLRAISAGWSIQVVEAKSPSIGIDTADDLSLARKRFNG
jgi:3-deoxy-manno-octulosonate cytidylyltransferase (CMP-KDO synthetase)